MIDSARRLARARRGRLPLRLRQRPVARVLERVPRRDAGDAPDSVTLGEVVETPALQRSYRGRLDGCLDFLLLARPCGGSSRSRASGPTEFDTFLRRHLAFFADDFVLPSFLDNHDMNRFLWVVGGDTRRLRLAALCQFTLPAPAGRLLRHRGRPVAASATCATPDGSGHPEESRLPMPWGERPGCRPARVLSAARPAAPRRPGAVAGGRRTVALDDDGRSRTPSALPGAGVEAVVALNNGDGGSASGLEPPAGWSLALATDDGTAIAEDVVRLPAFAGAVL